MKLSRRLFAIAEMVDVNAYVADIGSDHGHLPIYLVQNGRIEWAMAVENKMGPYLNLKHNVDAAGLSSHISISLSDGISVLNGGVDTLVLAGMGGQNVIDILAAHPEQLINISTIIVDPHRDLMKVRDYVSRLGFHIAKETMVKEDRVYYSIIKFVKGAPAKPYNEDELRFGPIIMEQRGEVFQSYLLEQKKKLNTILNGALSKEQRARYLAVYRSVSIQLARCAQDNEER